ncbi:phosphoglycerate dehydrogenase [Candidatus Woesearchaeota archaeon]|nr:phosphoglycerate dehydrogenase [Candidatus Woesearchaeota archaeon]
MKILIPDKVSTTAKERLDNFEVTQEPGLPIAEVNKQTPDAIVVRSYKLHDLRIGKKLTAIGRAGAGVNNIPVETCTAQGIVVFNTPGANANAVKELVLCGLLLSSRKIVQGVQWTGTLTGQENAHTLVEKNKSSFKGNELLGRTLGVIGLGAIGRRVANDALALGMDVIGFDPHISIEHAWQLSRGVQKAASLDEIYTKCDYITIHIPLLEQTRGMFDASVFSKLKSGTRLLNFSRDALVQESDLLDAIASGQVGCYVTDFPTDKLIGLDQVITIPHLGASTEEAEENCAVMIANQITDFLQYGNIKNSVNFPDCSLPKNGYRRITVVNRNTPGLLEQITQAVNKYNLNIEELLNKSKGDMAYTIVDVSGTPEASLQTELEGIEGVIRVRML